MMSDTTTTLAPATNPSYQSVTMWRWASAGAVVDAYRERGFRSTPTSLNGGAADMGTFKWRGTNYIEQGFTVANCSV